MWWMLIAQKVSADKEEAAATEVAGKAKKLDRSTLESGLFRGLSKKNTNNTAYVQTISIIVFVLLIAGATTYMMMVKKE